MRDKKEKLEEFPVGDLVLMIDDWIIKQKGRNLSLVGRGLSKSPESSIMVCTNWPH